jgi:hypothetical protein
VRRAGHRLADGALDLLQLLHQVQLRRQAAGGVGDDDVAAARAAGGHGIEAHRRRVAAFLADDLDAVAVGPHRELFARGGAEGVGRGQQHLVVGLGQVARELADAGGLAGAVDARHHDHRGLVAWADHQRLSSGCSSSVTASASSALTAAGRWPSCP